MEDSPRELRLSSTVRGAIIGGLVAAYAWFMHVPQASFSAGLLVAAALQVMVLVVRRFLPSDVVPQAIYLCEMIADGITVFLFALAVYGGIVRMPDAL